MSIILFHYIVYREKKRNKELYYYHNHHIAALYIYIYVYIYIYIHTERILYDKPVKWKTRIRETQQKKVGQRREIERNNNKKIIIEITPG